MSRSARLPSVSSAALVVDGSKHTACRAIGGWINARGIPWADAEAIVALALDAHPGVQDAAAGVQAARWAYQNGVTAGFAELRSVLGEAELGALESVTPDPTAEAAARTGDRIAQVLAERRAASEPDSVSLGEGAPSPYARLDAPLDLTSDDPPPKAIVQGLPILAGQLNRGSDRSRGGSPWRVEGD